MLQIVRFPFNSFFGMKKIVVVVLVILACREDLEERHGHSRTIVVQSSFTALRLIKPSTNATQYIPQEITAYFE
jgi:hypothetical protein